MDSGFDNGNDTAEPCGLKVGEKRKHAELTGSPVQVPPHNGDQARHLAWCKRDTQTSSPSKSGGPVISWRSKAVNRIGAKKNLADWDNQIRMSTPLPGLIYYKPDPSLARWSNWRSWPHLGISHDLGSDCLCASQALERKYKLCVTKCNDFDHATQRTLLDSLKSSGCHNFFLLMVVSWNLPNGPDNNDYRYAQIISSIEHCQKVHTARSCAVSLAVMIRQLRDQSNQKQSAHLKYTPKTNTEHKDNNEPPCSSVYLEEWRNQTSKVETGYMINTNMTCHLMCTHFLVP